MPGVAQRYWSASTLQGRRWMMEKRLEAVEQNDLPQLKQLLSAQEHQKPRELIAALQRAVMKCSDDFAGCVEVLLQHGANPSATIDSGTPFLHLAADAGCVEILRLLMKYKCDVHQTREDGATALHRAAQHGHVRCLEVLLEAGLDVNALDSSGRTPLILALHANWKQCIEILMKAGCDINIVDNRQYNRGKTVLWWALETDNFHIFNEVITKCDTSLINIPSDKGCTPLMVAARKGKKDLVKILLNYGANPDLRDDNGQTALLVATKERHFSSFDILLEAGCDVNIRDYQSASPLLYAISDSHIVKKLLNYGADPNEGRTASWTLLGICSGWSYCESGQYLLQANADVEEPGGPDNTKIPLQMAMYHGCIPIAKMLFIASVAMATDLKWLSAYLIDENFQQQAQENAQVKDIADWITGNMELYKPNEAISLKAACRVYIRNLLGCDRLWKRLGMLSLPVCLKNFLRLDELSYYNDPQFQQSSIPRIIV